MRLADFYLNPFTFVGYRNIVLFPIQILILWRLRNNADGHVWSLGRLWDNLLWFDSRTGRPPALTPGKPSVFICSPTEGHLSTSYSDVCKTERNQAIRLLTEFCYGWSGSIHITFLRFSIQSKVSYSFCNVSWYHSNLLKRQSFHSSRTEIRIS